MHRVRHTAPIALRLRLPRQELLNGDLHLLVCDGSEMHRTTEPLQTRRVSDATLIRLALHVQEKKLRDAAIHQTEPRSVSNRLIAKLVHELVLVDAAAVIKVCRQLPDQLR